MKREVFSRECAFESMPLTADRARPRVLLAILARQKQAVLPFYLTCIEALDYPKSSIVLYVRTNNNTDRTLAILKEWLGDAGHEYAGVEMDASDIPGVDPHKATSFKLRARLRQESIDFALRADCAFYFAVDVDNFIRPATLSGLVQLNLPIVAPLLRHGDERQMYANYHANVDDWGYHRSCEEYDWILSQRIKGLCQVPVVHSTYLVRCDVLPKLTYADGSDRHEYVIFSDSARKQGIPQYLDNREIYGYLAPDRNVGAAMRRLGAEIAETTAELATRAGRGRSPRRVFIHSSWRTSSTWVWLKFRQLPETMSYYEPFHGLLAKRTRAEAESLDYRSWDSNHPPGDPYGLEYLPLIRDTGGVPFADPSMAFEWFIPLGGLRGELRQSERRYLGFLIRYAELCGKVPVFGDTRTLGRLWTIKNTFGGYHVFLFRNLWRQWSSYLYYKRSDNFYFYDTMAWILASGGDPWFTYVVDYYARRRHMAADDVPGLLRSSSDDDLFAVFMAFHIYLYLHAGLSADLRMDVTRMARDEAYRHDIERALELGTGLSVSFADARDERRSGALDMQPDAIDWDEIRGHGRAAADALSGFADVGYLAKRADEYIDAAFAEAYR
jgi:hypothetical protein